MFKGSALFYIHLCEVNTSSSRAVFLNLFSLAAPILNKKKHFGGTPGYNFLVNGLKVQNFAAPLDFLQGSQVCRGTLVENHWSREMRSHVVTHIRKSINDRKEEEGLTHFDPL
jgi:hypothetical protein